MGDSMRKDIKGIRLYLLLVLAFWAFTFVTLNCWLRPYSAAYEQAGALSAGYLAYAGIGLVFSTPAPFLTSIWQEWYPNEGQQYMGTGKAALEVYSAGDMQSPDYECGIWVPVCRLPQSRESGTETAPAATPISREH